MSVDRDAGLSAGLGIFEHLFDASPDATIVVDASGRIVNASAQCEHLLGYKPAELIGQLVEMLIPAPFRTDHPAHRSSFHRQSRPRPMGAGRPLSARRRDGTTIPIEVSLSPIRSSGPMLVAAALRDISARIEAEKLLREARDHAESATLTKTRFLAAASHDLRQPLQSISAYASVLEAKSSDDEQLDIINKIHTSIAGMSELLDSLLDVSRLDAGKIEPQKIDFDLDRIFSRLREIFGPAALRKGLNLNISGDALRVHTDPALLERIVENFVTNAIKYTNNGHVTVSAIRVGHKIQIDVADSGTGIPEDQHTAIFEEYIQLENPSRDMRKGLGIGLALVKRLAELMQLELKLKSAPGEGSIFSVILPEADQHAHATPAATQKDTYKPCSTESIVVLFVEDNEAILDSVTLLLGLQGFDVHPAKDGDVAADLLKAGLAPNIIVSDFRLPGESGIDVIRTARADLKSPVPAIIMTGDTSAKQIESAGLVACTVLHKPTEPGELASHIRQIVASSR